MSIILTMYYWDLISLVWYTFKSSFKEGYNKDILNILVG